MKEVMPTVADPQKMVYYSKRPSLLEILKAVQTFKVIFRGGSISNLDAAATVCEPPPNLSTLSR